MVLLPPGVDDTIYDGSVAMVVMCAVLFIFLFPCRKVTKLFPPEKPSDVLLLIWPCASQTVSISATEVFDHQYSATFKSLIELEICFMCV